MKKISLIGAGQIGGTLAHLIGIKEIANEVIEQFVVDPLRAWQISIALDASEFRDPYVSYTSSTVFRVFPHSRSRLPFRVILLASTKPNESSIKKPVRLC